jgi:hypothetical protein
LRKNHRPAQRQSDDGRDDKHDRRKRDEHRQADDNVHAPFWDAANGPGTRRRDSPAGAERSSRAHPGNATGEILLHRDRRSSNTFAPIPNDRCHLRTPHTHFPDLAPTGRDLRSPTNLFKNKNRMASSVKQNRCRIYPLNDSRAKVRNNINLNLRCNPTAPANAARSR